MPAKKRKPVALDDVDHHLLALLQEDSGRTLRDLGELVGLSPSAVLRRVDRYRRGGLLARQVAVLDSRHAPEIVLAVCLVTVVQESPEHRRKFAQRLRSTPEVQQAYDVSGDWDYVVVLAAVGMAHKNDIARRLFQGDPNVQRYTTLFVLDPIKTGTAIPTHRE